MTIDKVNGFLYLMDIINQLKISFLFFCILVAIITILFYIFYSIEYLSSNDISNKNEIYKIYLNKAKNFLLITIISLILFSLIPTKNTIKMIGSTYIEKEISTSNINSDELNKILKSLDLTLEQNKGE